jgi:hypothetical protein
MKSLTIEELQEICRVIDEEQLGVKICDLLLKVVDLPDHHNIEMAGLIEWFLQEFEYEETNLTQTLGLSVLENLTRTGSREQKAAVYGIEDRNLFIGLLDEVNIKIFKYSFPDLYLKFNDIHC